MLHIINKSFSESLAMQECIKYLQSGCVILFIENAVYNAKIGTVSSLLESLPSEVNVYALHQDMQARGILEEDCYPFVKFIDYEGFVDLVEKNNPVRSWT